MIQCKINIPAAAVRAGDDLAGEREHENDRGVKNETWNTDTA